MITDYSAQTKSIAVQNTLVRNVYLWMAAALVITAITSFIVATTPQLAELIIGTKGVFFGLIIAELIVVMFLVARINKMSFMAALASFFAYSILNGLTLSVIFFAYEIGTIGATFLIAAGMFGAMAVFGATTKKDLTGFGSLFSMFLVGLIIAVVVNMFMKSAMMDYIISIAGVFIFTGLTAYDAQKIKALANQEVNDATSKLAVLGALTLYLDFINLFLFLLRLFGGRK